MVSRFVEEIDEVYPRRLEGSEREKSSTEKYLLSVAANIAVIAGLDAGINSMGVEERVAYIRSWWEENEQKVEYRFQQRPQPNLESKAKRSAAPISI
jgi:hypothetical protein